MVKRVIVLLFPLLLSASSANQIICRIEEQRVLCIYFIDRSDNAHGLSVRFIWHSPDGKDDRIQLFHVPPYHGSVYDYRFLPGREQGRWIVEVVDLKSHKRATTSFEINESSEDFFAD